jgi:death-on-curing protein
VYNLKLFLDLLYKERVQLAPKLLYPSFEAVMEAHDMLIRATGGDAGMISTSNLKYVLETIRDIGNELKDELFVVKTKAAYLIYGVIISHPFLDGNKRSAFEVAKRFLELNQWEFNPEEIETFEALLSIANGSLLQEGVEAWVGRNLRKR